LQKIKKIYQKKILEDSQQIKIGSKVLNLFKILV